MMVICLAYFVDTSSASWAGGCEAGGCYAFCTISWFSDTSRYDEIDAGSAHCIGPHSDVNNTPAPSAPTLPLERQPSNIPDDYVCPITFEPMTDPVMCADGFSYERSAIENWLRGHDTSPKTNLQLAHTNVTPNNTLRAAINTWHDRHHQRYGI